MQQLRGEEREVWLCVVETERAFEGIIRLVLASRGVVH